MALGTPKSAQLAMAFGMVINDFTRRTPMTALDIIEALMFTAGHAIPQKETIASIPNADIRKVREAAIAALDRGIEEGRKDRTKPQLFIPQGRSTN